MLGDEEKELRVYVERWRLASAKFEELRRQNLCNVNVAEHIEALNGAFEAALATQTRTTSGLVEQQAIFAKLRDARSVPPRRGGSNRSVRAKGGG